MMDVLTDYLNMGNNLALLLRGTVALESRMKILVRCGVSIE
jgi:hypothetical protein